MLRPREYQGAMLGAVVLFSIGATCAVVAVTGGDTSTTIFASLFAAGATGLGVNNVRVASRLQRVPPDLDNLLGFVLPFAKERLVTYSGVYPFGSVLAADGRKRLVEGYGQTDRPSVNEALNGLRERFHSEAQSKRIRASAICVGIRRDRTETGIGTEVLVGLENADGAAMYVSLPDRINADRSVEYGKLIAIRARPTIFVPQGVV